MCYFNAIESKSVGNYKIEQGTRFYSIMKIRIKFFFDL